MTRDEYRQSSARKGNGDALAQIYAPDGSADAELDRLIKRLGELPWPRSDPANPEKEAKQ